MFENLSSREKKMLVAVGALLPVTIVFLLVFWWIGSIDENNGTLTTLDRQIAEQKDLQLQGKRALRRKNYYSHISLPKSINDASNDYQRWLKSTLTDVGLNLDSITPRDGEVIRSGNRLIGRGKVLEIRATGRLEELNDFLTDFYTLNLMHRIRSLTLIPISEGTGSKAARNGSLKINMTVEIMALNTGRNRDDFADLVREPLRTEDQYAQILYRNIFGPANNQPLFESSTKKTVTGGRAVSFSISGKDGDKQDLLNFELIESAVADAKLTQKRIDDRRVQFSMPDQAPGDYDFKIKITDNGYPSKSIVETLTVTVREKKKPTVAKKKTEEPELDYIKLVRIRGISVGSDGIERAWMDIPKLGGTLKLAVNESFAIDKTNYSVVSINKNRVRISGNDKTFVGKLDFITKGRLVETKE